jgi:hypothetical protein
MEEGPQKQILLHTYIKREKQKADVNALAVKDENNAQICHNSKLDLDKLTSTFIDNYILSSKCIFF